MKVSLTLFVLLLIFIMSIGCRKLTTDDFNVEIGDKFIIDSSENEIRQFPFLHAFDGMLILSYSQHPDTNMDGVYVDGYQMSRDGGMTWSQRQEEEYSFFTSMIKLKNGEYLGLQYNNLIYVDNHLSRYYYGISDDGILWEKYQGSINIMIENGENPATNVIAFHRSILMVKDETLIASMYGKFEGDTRYRSFIVKSLDDGKNWSYLSTIAYDPEIGTDEGFCEPVISRMRNGNLICVMRAQMFNEFTYSKALPLYYTVSKDEGLTWDKPRMIPVAKNTDAFSVDPDLCLSDDGLLLLTYGRPGCRLLISPDGNGKTWIGPFDIESGKTSGYTGIKQVAVNKYLIVGDEGANWANPSRYSIWGRFITINKQK